MAFIYRIPYVHFDQFSSLIVNLLPKPQRLFFGIDLFEIARLPSESSRYFMPVATSAVW